MKELVRHHDQDSEGPYEGPVSLRDKDWFFFGRSHANLADYFGQNSEILKIPGISRSVSRDIVCNG